MERLFAFSQAELLRYLLIMCRVSPLMVAAPFWGSPLVPAQVRLYLALLVSVLLLPVVRAPLPADLATSLGSLVGAVAVELLIGFLLAYAAILLFSAVQLAGQLADIQMGFGVANVIDPLTSAQVTLMGQVQYLVALLVFLLMDGHHIFLRGLVDTFATAPPGHGLGSALPLTLIVERGGRLLFTLAAQIAAPVLTALFLSNLAMGLISRVLPQINIFIVGLPLNVGIGLLAFAAGISVFTIVWRGALDEMARQMAALAAALR